MFGLSHKRIPQTACFGKTDTGLRRSNNEDAFIVRPELGLCLVADGMGGAAAGELASNIFAETTLEVFSKTRGQPEQETFELVQRAFAWTNERILNHVKENPHHQGMGCTAELVAFSDESFVLGHMGDSRTYRFRTGQLKQLEFKEISEGTAVYYLAETKVSDGEFLKFDLKIIPEGETKAVRLQFNKRFFTY